MEKQNFSKLSDALTYINLRKDNIYIEGDGPDLLSYHSIDPDPKPFIIQARKDLINANNSEYFNSILNSRRAVRAQVDRILNSLGFEAKKMNIKKKIQLLRQLGLPSPNILKRIDEPRNNLEHNYVIPKKEDVEDALDIAELFLEATSRGLNPIETRIYIKVKDDKKKTKIKKRMLMEYELGEKFIDIDVDQIYKLFSIKDYWKHAKDHICFFKSKIYSSDNLYIPILRLMIVFDKGDNDLENTVVKELIDKIYQD